MALSEAFNEELHDLADAGCAVIQVEEPQIHLLAARGGGQGHQPRVHAEGSTTRQGCGEDGSVVPHVLGNPSQQRMFERAVLQAGAGAAQPGDDGRDHVRDEELEPAGPGGGGAAITDKKVVVGAIDHHTLQVETPQEGRT